MTDADWRDFDIAARARQAEAEAMFRREVLAAMREQSAALTALAVAIAAASNDGRTLREIVALAGRR